MNDIPRGTSRGKLARFLLAQSSSPAGPLQQQPQVVFGSDISDSRLDDELSVAILEFSNTPAWLLSQDPSGFPKFTLLGTIWRGVDRHATDTNGRSEFIRAVINSPTRLGLQYAEMLAEFTDTDVNIQDEQGRTALHWACVELLADMVRLCLSVPDCATGLRDNDGLTAFDIALRSGDDFLPSLFYSSMLEIEQSCPQVALLRVLTLSSDETRFENKPLFPGEALFQPVGERNEALVVALLDRGVVLTTKDEDGNTALHIAAGQVDNVDIVTRLVEAGSHINAIGHRGSTPLHNAVRTADAEMVELLLHHNANVAIADEDEMSPLRLAVVNGRTDITVVLRQGGSDIHASDRLERTVVGVAEANRKVESVEFLNAPDKKHPQVAPDPYGPAPQVLVLRPSRSDVRVERRSGPTTLLEAARLGDLHAVQELLAQGADPAAVNMGPCTALHLAAKGGHREIIECLLAHGANPEASAEYGITALHCAILYGQASTVEALIAGGAKIEWCTNGRFLYTDTENTHYIVISGYRALHLAACIGGAEIVKTLLLYKPQIEAKNHENMTALHLAAAYGPPEAVSMLLAAGARVDAVTKFGNSPLHLATVHERSGNVRSLLDAGAAIEVANECGVRPLHNAAESNSMEIVLILLSAGADTEARTTAGKTASEIALCHGHTAIVSMLGARTPAVDRFRFNLRHRLGRNDS